VRLRIERHDLTWEVDFDGTLDGTTSPREAVDAHGIRRATRDDSGAITFDADKKIGHLDKSALRALVDRGVLALDSLAGVAEMRCYSDFFAYQLRIKGSEYSADTHLHPTGLNVLTVLRNWKDKRATRLREEFVVEALREAFPGFVDLEFEATSNVVDANVVSESLDTAVAMRTAANGFIHAMMSLTAVASTPPGGLVTIDEPETALHPHAIRRMLEAMADWSKGNGIDIILSTHSPVIIDWMHDRPEHVMVFSPADGPGPRPLTALREPAFLARFSAGEEYAQSRLGAPVSASAPLADE
jgi:predicted ATPase